MKTEGMTTNVKYTPTLHAVERLEQRLGVAAYEATTWINEAIRTATFLFTQVSPRGITQSIYEINNARIVVDDKNKTVVTILPQVDSSFLRPIFERERRKLYREITRNSRRYELEQAETMTELAENALNKARARNPKTRALIQTRIDELEAKIKRYDMKIKNEQERMGNFEKATGAFI